MKTNKSLLIKVLTIVSALCLSMAMVFGLVGCGEEARYIVGSEIIDGILYVTYSDSTTPVKVGPVGEVNKPDDSCEHKNINVIDKVYSFNGENKDYCGYKLAACLDCDFVTVEFVAHKEVETPKIEATCLKPGQEAGTKCEVCDRALTGNPIYKDHEWDENVKTVYDDETSLNKCESGWSELKVCKVCGTTELIKHEEGKGHKGELTTFGNNPTLTGEAQLYVKKCTECGGENLPVEKLPAFNSGEYTVELVDSQTTYENVKYVIEVEGYAEEAQKFEFAGTRGHSYKEGASVLNNLIADYSVEAYPEVSLKAGETLKCDDTAVAVFKCVTCNTFVEVNVQAEHVYDETFYTAEKIEALTCSTFGCDFDGKKKLELDCKNCADGTVEYEVEAYGHKLALDPTQEPTKIENGPDAGKYSVTLICTRDCVDDYTTTKAIEIDFNDPEQYKAPTCSEKGFIKYTEGELSTTLELGVVDHAIGYNGETAVRIKTEPIQTIDYADYVAFASNLVTTAGNDKIECGKTVTAMFKCVDCSAYVNVEVSREHDFATYEVKTQGDCENPTVYEFTCKYADCANHETKGTVELPGKHKYTFESGNITDGVVVSCDVDGCKVPSFTATVAANELSQKSVTGTKCGESGIEYTFKIGDVEYTVFDADEDIHVFKGQEFNAVDTSSEIFRYFSLAEAAKIAGEGDPTCAVPVKGIVTCERCNAPVEVKIIGEHKPPMKEDGVTIDYVPASCTEDQYYVCQNAGCQEGKIYVPNTKLGHSYKLETATFGSLPATVEVVCKEGDFSQVVDVEVAAGKFVANELCDKTIYTYADYVLSNGVKYTITFTVNVGDHDFVEVAGEDVISVWTESNGGNFYVAGKYCTECKQMIVYAKVEITEESTALWVNDDGSYNIEAIIDEYDIKVA